ncbi:hypothetical protein L3X38_034299 [Prunus dulcis]|uniref:Uncharacterized protein n=1 Tax=Prunus dulcis TaxID=3755 RepID=A0AAD4YXR8_PRUDU|nr:hypothetical protein L3X38_034299 [Prunus dulcis]
MGLRPWGSNCKSLSGKPVSFILLSGDPRYWGWVQETSDGPTEAAELLKIIDGVNLTDKAREQWIEIPVGNFIASPQKPGDIEFSLYEYDGRWKSGLVIKGVVVRPKY